MKKLLIVLLALMMILAVVGCAKTDTTDTGDTSDTTSDTTTDSGSDAPAGDAVKEAALAYFAGDFTNPMIGWEDLFTLIDNGEEPFILSIRQQDVYDQGHITGAYLASWGADLAAKVSMLPKDQTVYVYCYSGQTAGQTVAILRMLGIDAISVKSGYNYGASTIEGYENYVSTEAAELPDAGAEFDADVLAWAESYFNSVSDNGNFQIASADADVMIQNGEAVLLDIRQPDAYAAGTVDGAVNLPFGAGMDFSGLSMDDKYIVMCYTGQTAGQTTAVMKALGYDAVSLKFGAQGWGEYVTKAAANAYFAAPFTNPMISWEDLFAMMDNGDEPFIVSIRQADVYGEGHITGAMLASWGTDLAEKVAMLPTDQTVYVYCYSGQTAGQAVALMRMLGIDAISVKSGFNYGASTIEGYENYVSTEATELPDAGASFDPFVLSAVKNYFNSVADNGNFQISLDDVQAETQAGTATVVDIRTAEDFAAGHVAGAVNFPFGENMQETFGDLPAGKLIVACYSGQTAGQTTAILRMLGYDAVSMKFGMKVGWIAEGYPVVTD